MQFLARFVSMIKKITLHLFNMVHITLVLHGMTFYRISYVAI